MTPPDLITQFDINRKTARSLWETLLTVFKQWFVEMGHLFILTPHQMQLIVWVYGGYVETMRTLCCWQAGQECVSPFSSATILSSLVLFQPSPEGSEVLTGFPASPNMPQFGGQMFLRDTNC